MANPTFSDLFPTNASILDDEPPSITFDLPDVEVGVLQTDGREAAALVLRRIHDAIQAQSPALRGITSTITVAPVAIPGGNTGLRSNFTFTVLEQAVPADIVPELT